MDKIGPGDPLSQSPDLARENLARLASLFPEAVTEGPDGPALNVDVLKQLVGDATVTDVDEKYGLNWHGKRAARRLALTPSAGTLRPTPEESVEWDTTKNLMIEGDNLEVLKLLQKAYVGKVKMIYMDPPYNTGKDFVYKDDYHDSLRSYLQLTSQVDINGSRLSTNSETSGRFHTDWLNMIFPRLVLAKDLLSKDGVLFISIDDAEVSNLHAVLCAVFGEENVLGILPTVMNLKGNNDEFGFAGTHEYTVVAAADKNSCVLGEFDIDDEEQDDWLEDEIGPYKRGANLKATGGNAPREKRPNLFFPLYVSKSYDRVSLVRELSSDIEVLPITSEAEMSWRWSRNKFASHSSDVIITIGPEGTPTFYKKQRPALGELPSKKPKSLLYKPEYSSGNGTVEVKRLFGTKLFDAPPKPLGLLKDLVRIGAPNGGTVLDCFAGTASTGHALYELALETEKNYAAILIQLPERIDNASYGTIAEITKERLRRSGAAVRKMEPIFPVDTGFRVYKLDSSSVRPWNPGANSLADTLLDAAETVKSGRSEKDLLTEVMLKRGIELTALTEVHEVTGERVHAVGGGVLLACFAESISDDKAVPLAEGIAALHRALAPAGETAVLFRDSAFASDVAKTNLAATLDQYGLKNVRSL